MWVSRAGFVDKWANRRALVWIIFPIMPVEFGAVVHHKEGSAQTSELLCKVLCHNICCVIQSMYELGIEARFASLP